MLCVACHLRETEPWSAWCPGCRAMMVQAPDSVAVVYNINAKVQGSEAFKLQTWLESHGLIDFNEKVAWDPNDFGDAGLDMPVLRGIMDAALDREKAARRLFAVGDAFDLAIDAWAQTRIGARRVGGNPPL